MWNSDVSANRLSQIYIENYLDISGGDLIVRGNVQMNTGNAHITNMTLPTAYTSVTDMSLTSIVSVGDVSMGDISLNIGGDISINGNLLVSSYAANSISVNAVAGGDEGGNWYTNTNTVATVTTDISFADKLTMSNNVYMNAKVIVDLNIPVGVVSTDKKQDLVGGGTMSSKNWSDVAMSSTGQYLIAIVGDAIPWTNIYNTGNVWISIDYGSTWRELNNPDGDENGDYKQVSSQAKCWYKAMISGNGAIMMVKATGAYLYRSVDYGKTWTQVSYPNNYDEFTYQPENEGIVGPHITMSVNGNYIYTYRKSGSGTFATTYPEATMIMSSNGGSTWSDIGSQTYIQYMCASKSGQYIYITRTKFNLRPIYSNDYGSSFITLTNGPLVIHENVGYQQITMNHIFDNGIVYAVMGNASASTVPYFYKADLTTGTVSAGANNVSFSSVVIDRGLVFITVLGTSNDGKYIIIQGEQNQALNIYPQRFNRCVISTDYGASFYTCSRAMSSPFYWVHNGNDVSGTVIKTWGGRFSDDNKYLAMASSNGYIYVRNLFSNEINYNKSTYFGSNTTLKLNNDISGILFSDGTRITTYNDNILSGSYANGNVIFNDSSFNNMTVIGDFASNPQLSVSDYRIKTNIQSLDNQHTLDNVQPVVYNQTLLETIQIGFIADQLQQVYPELVEGEKDGDQMQSINYNGLIPIMIHELQQLKKRVQDM